MFELRKTLTFIIKVFLGGFKSVLWMVLNLSCFRRTISSEKGEKYPIPDFSPMLLHLGEGVLV